MAACGVLWLTLTLGRPPWIALGLAASFGSYGLLRKTASLGALEGLGRFTSQGSGILVTMVVGGAVIPEIQGYLADSFGYQPSFAIVLLCYAYILFFALKGHRNLNAVEATDSLNPAIIQ